jgi:hypothetical protein
MKFIAVAKSLIVVAVYKLPYKKDQLKACLNSNGERFVLLLNNLLND